MTDRPTMTVSLTDLAEGAGVTEDAMIQRIAEVVSKRRDGPYRVEVDPHRPGCAHCGAGKMWWIVDGEGVGSGKSWRDEGDCQEDCDTLNMAYQAGWDSAMDALPVEDESADPEAGHSTLLPASEAPHDVSLLGAGLSSNPNPRPSRPPWARQRHGDETE